MKIINDTFYVLMFYAVFKNHAHFILDLLQSRPPPVKGAILSWGYHPIPWQLFLGSQWNRKLHLRFPPPWEFPWAELHLPESPPNADPSPNDDHSHRLFCLVPEKGTHGFGFCMCFPSLVPPLPHAPDHPRALHSSNVGIFDSV